MAARKDVNERLQDFASSCETLHGEDLVRVVNKALDDRHYRLVAKAAMICGERFLHDMETGLINAYRRFLDNPTKSDPQCIAKGAIVRALVTLDCQNHEFFLSAMRHRQLEPVWGGTVDTALDLRNASAMGLVGTSYPRAAVAIAELLNDNESYVRIGALRALVVVPQDRAEPLLRFKALSGDPEPEVVGECLSALMQLEPDDSLDFVADFLGHKDLQVAAYAALALGESRHPPALEAIRTAFCQPYVEKDFRRILVRAAVLQRNEPAYQWLIELVRKSDTATSKMVIQELGIYHTNAKLQSRLKSALTMRNDPALLHLFRKIWKTN